MMKLNDPRLQAFKKDPEVLKLVQEHPVFEGDILMLLYEGWTLEQAREFAEEQY